MLHVTLRLPQFLSPHSSAHISELLVYTLSFCIYCSPIPVVSNGTYFVQPREGEQKRVTKNRTPLERATIEASLNDSFPTQSGKKLQLETLVLDSRLIGL